MEEYEESLRQHGLDLSTMVQIRTGGNEPPMKVFGFSTSDAKCETCLDLRSDYLRRQWRKVSLGAVEAPYSFPLQQLEESIQDGTCEPCCLVGEAVHKIKERNPYDFKRAQLEFLGPDECHGEQARPGLEGLSLILTMKYPEDVSREDATRAIKDVEMRIDATETSDLEAPEAKFEISSSRYEIYTTSQFDEGVLDASKITDYSAIKWRPHRSGATGSKEAMGWAAEKIRACTVNHSQCSENHSRTLPKRVLDLGEVGNSASEGHVKLYEFEETVQAEYVCLSHCWGKKSDLIRPLETTRDNIEKHRHGIPWDHLPKTFQDAVTFTRGIGIRYLWVDSLCIIQGDIKDWRIEAGKMAGIYQNALLTLSAATARNSHEGLFRKSEKHHQLTRDPSLESIFLRKFPDAEFFNSDTSSHSDMRNLRSVLMTRGWVFQERLLSRRLLLFTPTELYWQCSANADSESGYAWSSHTIKRHWQQEAEADRSQQAMTHLWHSLVREFTALELTHHTDLLPSIAGLAKNLQPFLKDAEYLAGCWSSTFISDLLWKRAAIPMGGRKNLGSVNDYSEVGNPTWSWASNYGPKYFEGTVLGELASLGSAAPVMDDPFMTSRTSVVISGFMIPAKLATFGIKVNNFPSIGWSADNADYDWSTTGDLQVKGQDDRLYVMPLAATENSGTLEEDFAIQLLILHQEKDHSTKFRRIGLCSIDLLLIWPNQVMLEGKDLLLQSLDSVIKYGESMLQEDGRYRRDEEARRIWFFDFGPSRKDTHFENVASAQFGRFGLGRSLDMDFEEFYGMPHLNWMKERRAEEMERINEWSRQNEAGETPRKYEVTII